MYKKQKVVINLISFNKEKKGIWSVETYSPGQCHFQDAAGGLNILEPKFAPWKCVDFEVLEINQNEAAPVPTVVAVD